MFHSFKDYAEEIFALADIQIDGNRPWDLKVLNNQFYHRIFAKGSLGLGESYMDGWWECISLDQFFDHILRAELQKKVQSWRIIWPVFLAIIKNKQNKRRAFNIGKTHYDIGNALYKRMLDKRMVYTCAYWKEADNLYDAQEAKLDLVCKKIGLKKGDRILDIGCGWGSFERFAAEKYGAEVVGLTISKEQAELARKYCAGLSVEIRLQDYRDIHEQFDHIVSLGMFEHVGYKNYRIYMEVVARCLKENGLFLLHTIGSNISAYLGDPWIDKYIFPDGMVPSIAQIGKAIEGVFILEDWCNFGLYYDKTLLAWFHNFDSHWIEIKDQYTDRFYRMWKYYLLSCAGSFRSHFIELWQIVLSKNGVEGGYQRIF